MNSYVARALVATITTLLPRKQAYQLAERLAPRLLGGKTTRLRTDMHELFPEKPDEWIDDMVRKQAAHRAWMTIDKVMLARMSNDELMAACDPESLAGMHRVCDEALAGGKGAVVYTLHFGRPTCSPFFLAANYPSVGLRAKTGISGFDTLMNKRLDDLGVEIVQAGDVGAGVQIMRALRKNKLLYMLADGKRTQQMTPVDFLGRKIPFGLGFVELARRTGSALIASATRSTGPVNFKIDMRRVELPVADVPLADAGAAILKPLEDWVREDIGQWYGINRAFRQARGFEAEIDDEG